MKELMLFEDERRTVEACVEQTAETLRVFGGQYRHWAYAFSGGKDSTAGVAATLYCIEKGLVPAPASFTVVYGDTRLELPPLHASAMKVLGAVRARGHRAEVVCAEMGNRFWVYVLGRGVPPPSNVFRWCTERIKIRPAEARLAELREELGEKFLLLTGMRVGESQVRDGKLEEMKRQACSKNSGECGQGWFQEMTPAAVADVLHPVAHWGVCRVWDWLAFYEPEHGLPTSQVAEAYGQGEEGSPQELNARTGCVGCNLIEEDLALERVLRLPKWSYLAPLREIRPLLRYLKEPRNRLGRPEVPRQKSARNFKERGVRVGPLTLEARERGLAKLKEVERAVNAGRGEMPPLSLVNAEEEAAIRGMWAGGVWPRGWTGEEAGAEELHQIRGRGVASPPSLFG